jgi:RNA polymerase sigma factor (TIGR02999 family)
MLDHRYNPASGSAPLDEAGALNPSSSMQKRTQDLTILLQAVNESQPGATDQLAGAIHEELRAMARRHLSRDFGPNLAGITIQPTVLANDTLMKLIRQRGRFDNSGHFFAIASRLMMRVLIDYHRERKAQKRGGGQVCLSLDPGSNEPVAPSTENDLDIEALDAALEKLSQLGPRKADVVRYRVLWGMTVPQIGEALGVAVATVERDWAFAKVWLAKELKR